MAEHENIYRDETEQYHALVSFEDFSGNLQASIKSIIPAGASILETGAGAGRVTTLLAPLAGKLVSLDLSVPMLTKALASTPPKALTFSGYAAADHRFLPVSDHQYDWIISGWSVCYLVSWHRDLWKQEVNLALQEFSHVLRPDGHILLIETLGTGEISPKPPDHLTAYLDYLDSLGFQRQWIRTDYRFPDESTARDLTGFFFGDGMLKNINFQPVPVLPECTGLWTISQADLLKNFPD